VEAEQSMRQGNDAISAFGCEQFYNRDVINALKNGVQI